jgi:outer membrane protein OmpA-like peptidoglycan-associated protein
MLREQVVRQVLSTSSFVGRSAAACTLIVCFVVAFGSGCASKKTEQTTTAELIEETGGPQEDGSLHGESGAFIDPDRQIRWEYSAMPTPAPGSQPKYLLKSYRCEKGSSALNNESRGSLGLLVQELKAKPSARVVCVGLTDGQAESVNAQNLGMSRAQTAKEYLINQGIAKDRIETASFAATQATAGPDEAIGQAEERRVEVWLISE